MKQDILIFKLLSRLTSHCGLQDKPRWSPRNAEQVYYDDDNFDDDDDGGGCHSQF